MKEEKKLAAMFLRRMASFKEDDAEIFHESNKGIEITGFSGEITSLSNSFTQGLGARVFRSGRTGSCYTEDVSRKGVDSSLKQASQQIPVLKRNPGRVLYPGDRVLFSASAYGEELDCVPLEAKKEFVLKLEEAAKALDSKIVNVPHARYVESHRTVTIVTSRGMKKSQGSAYCGAVLQVASGKGRTAQTYAVTAADRSFYELSPLRIAQEAVTGVLDKRNPKAIDSGSYPVVFSHDAASKLLGAFFISPHSHVYGENAYTGRSRFSECIGGEAASELVTVYDHPRSDSLFYRDFDDEGFPTGKLVLIQDGVLKGFAHSIYSAKLFGTTPTGHSMRGGYMDVPATGLHAPCLTNGEHDLDDLFDMCTRGVYITELTGLHAGINPLTGDFSLSATGFQIEKGRQGRFIGQCIVAGNCFELLKGITAKAGNRRRDRFFRFSSPAILVSRLSVSS